MSFNYNRVALAGNLTRDPELKIAGSSEVCKFSIAINDRYKAKDGTVKENVTFVDLEAWGKTAQFVSQYFTKGKGIFVEGRLKMDTWEDKDGTKKSKMKVSVDNVSFVGGDKRDGEQAQAASGNAGAPRAVPATSSGDDEPPF